MAEHRRAATRVSVGGGDSARTGRRLRGQLGLPSAQMKLTCNIDQRGKKARLRGGVVVDLCGAALIITGVLTKSMAILGVGIFLCITGSFMIFEGANGWCALRAMGIKTPM